MRRQDPSQITGRHSTEGDWEEVGGGLTNLLGPPRALGRPLCAVWKQQNNDPGNLQRSNTPMGPWPGEFCTRPVIRQRLLQSALLRLRYWDDEPKCPW